METKLAVLGGKPIRTGPLHSYNTIGKEEKEAVMAVLDSGELSGFVAGPIDRFWGGVRVRDLEKAFCETYGVKYAIAVNSATSGLHCAVSAMGVGPGDEVITTPTTMSATATTILMTGAIPIFADIEDETFCLDPKSVEERITPYTKGIVAVNLFGHSANYNALKKIAEKHKLFIIEDNAQAPHAKYHGKWTGTVGHAGVFSFNRHKTMQSGEGGVLITNDESIAFKAACMRNHGENVVEEMGKTDIVNTIGVNYRMTEMEAAVALCQFRKLEKLNQTRVARAQRLDRGLADVPGVTAPKIADGCTHSYYFYMMKYDAKETGIPRDLFVKAVTAEGFQIRAGYVVPLYFQPVYQKKICFGNSGFPFTASKRPGGISYPKGLCPTAERLHNEQFMLTNIIHEPYTLEDMDDFVGACRKVLNNRDALLASKR